MFLPNELPRIIFLRHFAAADRRQPRHRVARVRLRRRLPPVGRLVDGQEEDKPERRGRLLLGREAQRGLPHPERALRVRRVFHRGRRKHPDGAISRG